MNARVSLALVLFSASSMLTACSSTTTTKVTGSGAGGDAGPDASAGGSGGSTGGSGATSSGGSGGSVGSAGSAGSSGSLGSGGTSGTAGSSGSAGQGGCPTLAGPVLVPVDGFCIDRTEVTNAEYEEFLGVKGGDTSGQIAFCTLNTLYEPSDYWPAPIEELEMPVVYVDWCDAYAYCTWAGKRLCGKIGGGSNAFDDYADAERSQWYDVCSNGGRNAYPYGGIFNPEACNGFDGPKGCNGSGSTSGTCAFSAVGSYPQCQGAGSYAGVFDLSGNVLEWEDSCTSNPDGGEDTCRLRGGSIYARADHEMACDTDSVDIRSHTAPGLGFRCCYP